MFKVIVDFPLWPSMTSAVVRPQVGGKNSGAPLPFASFPELQKEQTLMNKRLNIEEKNDKI